MLFSAEITEFKAINNVLRAIAFTEYVIVQCMEEGLKFTLEEMRSVETSAYIPKSMFYYYRVKDTKNFHFKISMKAFTECLNIFGDEGNPSIKMVYKSDGSPLSLLITHSEENVTVDCELKTLSVEECDGTSLADECNLNNIVLNGNTFLEVLQRLDNASEELKIAISPDAPYFTLTATGAAGESTVSIPKHSVSLFKCTQGSTAVYSFNHIRQIFKVMNHAKQVIISTGESGLLRIQLTVASDDNDLYVEYYVTSQFGDF